MRVFLLLGLGLAGCGGGTFTAEDRASGGTAGAAGDGGSGSSSSAGAGGLAAGAGGTEAGAGGSGGSIGGAAGKDALGGTAGELAGAGGLLAGAGGSDVAGTGGALAGTGGALAGSGGDAGGGGMPLACGLDKGDAAYTFIDDFEDGDALVGNELDPPSRAGRWFFGSEGCSEAPEAHLPGKPPSHFAGDSAGGITVASSSAECRMWIGFDLNRCEDLSEIYNVSAYRGLQFRYSTDGAFRVKVSTYSTAPAEEGGGCTGSSCGVYHSAEQSSGSANAQVAWLALADDTAPPSSFGSGQALAVYFEVSGAYGLWLDDVAFY